jgi:hypothetical protein
LAESDLLPLTDQRLNIGQAKSTNTLGSLSKGCLNAPKKLIFAAEVLKADENILGDSCRPVPGLFSYHHEERD